MIYGGSLENGIIDGLFLATKQLADKKKIEIDRRKIKNQLILLAVIKGSNLEFTGSAKAKLNMPKVRKKVKEFVADKTLKYLADNENIAQQILDKLVKNE